MEAWAKSGARAGSLGVSVEEAVVVGKPWNWLVRSSYWAWRDCSDCLRVARALGGVSGWVYGNGGRKDARFVAGVF